MCNVNEYLINKKNLLSNIQTLRRRVGNRTKICAVVKADAYGLGVKNVCPLIDDDVDFYAVASVMEAFELRNISSQKPILILGACDLNYANECAQKGIRLTISSLDEVKFLNKYLETIALVHLKINTGMNRYGIGSIKVLKEILAEIKHGGKIIVEGVFTHFATKSSDPAFIEEQYEKFASFLDFIPQKNLIIHCASSFVSFTDKGKHCSMVRVGFGLYSSPEKETKIKNVVSVRARVMFLHDVEKGESVGYERTYFATKKTKVAVCSMGYADGFARNLGNNFKVLINGEYAPVIGRVCMDCFMVDVTKIKNVFVGSSVTILGKDGNNEITLDDIAKAVNFSPYEVLLNFRKRRMNVKLIE